MIQIIRINSTNSSCLCINLESGKKLKLVPASIRQWIYCLGWQKQNDSDSRVSELQRTFQNLMGGKVILIQEGVWVVGGSTAAAHTIQWGELQASTRRGESGLPQKHTFSQVLWLQPAKTLRGPFLPPAMHGDLPAQIWLPWIHELSLPRHWEWARSSSGGNLPSAQAGWDKFLLSSVWRTCQWDKNLL